MHDFYTNIYISFFYKFWYFIHIFLINRIRDIEFTIYYIFWTFQKEQNSDIWVPPVRDLLFLKNIKTVADVTVTLARPAVAMLTMRSASGRALLGAFDAWGRAEHDGGGAAHLASSFQSKAIHLYL